MPFDETDYRCHVYGDGDDARRWIIVRIRGHEYSFPPSEAEALHRELESALVRVCDPTPLPAADPPLEHPPTQIPLGVKTKPPHRPLSLEDLESL